MSDEKKGMSKGCMIVLIIVSVIILLVIASSIVCYIKRDQLMEWGILKMTSETETLVAADPPEGVTAEEVHSLIATFTQNLKDKKIGPTEMQGLALFMQEIWGDRKIDKDEGAKFIEELKKVNSSLSGGSGIEPEPAQDSIPRSDSI
jgi:hypothetical protein